MKQGPALIYPQRTRIHFPRTKIDSGPCLRRTEPSCPGGRHSQRHSGRHGAQPTQILQWRRKMRSLHAPARVCVRARAHAQTPSCSVARTHTCTLARLLLACKVHVVARCVLGLEGGPNKDAPPGVPTTCRRHSHEGAGWHFLMTCVEQYMVATGLPLRPPASHTYVGHNYCDGASTAASCTPQLYRP